MGINLSQAIFLLAAAGIAASLVLPRFKATSSKQTSSDGKASQLTPEAPGAATSASNSSKAKSKKKKVKKQQQQAHSSDIVASAKEAVNEVIAPTPVPAAPQEVKGAADVPAVAPAEDAAVPPRTSSVTYSKVAAGKDDLDAASSEASATNLDNSAVPRGTVTMDDYEDAEPQEEEVWQSVSGRGAAKNVVNQSGAAPSTASSSSFASKNPFAVLPSASTKAPKSSSASHSISIGGAASSPSPARKSASAAAAAAEQTKRQRQNAARNNAAKEARAAEEQARVAKMEAHRRQVQMERIRAEEAKRASGSPKGKPNGAGNGSAKRGGLDAKASVNGQGQLVWD